MKGRITKVRIYPYTPSTTFARVDETMPLLAEERMPEQDTPSAG